MAKRIAQLKESELLETRPFIDEGNQQPIKDSLNESMATGKGSSIIPQGSRAVARSAPDMETYQMI